MSKSKVTAGELYNKIVGEIGDPGGLVILVLRSDDGGWLAKVYDGRTPLPESGFQAALDDIVARLRLRYDLCLYSAIPPMTPEGMRNHVRTMRRVPGAIGCGGIGKTGVLPQWLRYSRSTLTFSKPASEVGQRPT
jgi:hypothetical protein